MWAFPYGQNEAFLGIPIIYLSRYKRVFASHPVFHTFFEIYNLKIKNIFLSFQKSLFCVCISSVETRRAFGLILIRTSDVSRDKELL